MYIKVAWPSNLKIWCKCAFVHAGECPSHLTQTYHLNPPSNPPF